MATEGGFTVNPVALRETSRSLVVVAAHLDSARETARSANVDGFGSERLATATRAFVDHWEWQANHLSSSLSETANRLQQAMTQYESVEDAQLRAQGGS